MKRALLLTLSVLFVAAGCAVLVHAFWLRSLEFGDAQVVMAGAFVGVGLLLIALLLLRRRAAGHERRAKELTRLTGQLEASIGALEVMNTRLLASEAALTEARDKAEENSQAKSQPIRWISSDKNSFHNVGELDVHIF